MNIYDVVLYDKTRPNDNTVTKRVWAQTSQEAVDKVRATGIINESNNLVINTVSQIINCKDWE
jgi:hypothetical protein